MLVVEAGGVAASGDQQTLRVGNAMLRKGAVPHIEPILVLQQTESAEQTAGAVEELDSSRESETTGSFERLETVPSLFRLMK